MLGNLATQGTLADEISAQPPRDLDVIDPCLYHQRSRVSSGGVVVITPDLAIRGMVMVCKYRRDASNSYGPIR